MTIDVQAATELYLYGYPLVYCTDEIRKLSSPQSTLLPGGVPFNRFGRARQLLGPDAKFVSPNNDTLYVVAPLDMSGGPILLHTPDTGDRYYVLQFVDAWSNNVAYVGRRATGTKAARLDARFPGYAGEVPPATTAIEVPTDVAVIVGRVQVDGEADLPAVHALQDQFTLSPAPGAGPGAGIPHADARRARRARLLGRFRAYLRRFPPPDADREFVELAANVGLLDEQSPFVEPDPALAAVLAEGLPRPRGCSSRSCPVSGAEPGAWTSALHMFDYNLDRCGLGTIDSPDWKIADRKRAYVTRAVAARAGLWGNHGYEADYEIIHQDEHGDVLNGGHRYQVTFDPPPPANAFWSLTMYDTPDYYLVANPIDRYSIGDRTPGLRYGDDGSVTITCRSTTRRRPRAANWLPAPTRRLSPILRMYEPGPSVLDGTYPLPRVRRLD